MKPVFVTDHAIERYRERVGPMPESAIRQILTSDVITAAAALGCKSVKIDGGVRAIIKDGGVVTVVPSHRFKPRKKRRKPNRKCFPGGRATR